MPGQGIPLGDILDDSGYAHRDAGPGPSRCGRRRAARPGPAPPRPRPQGHPRRRHHQQRQPVLPPDTAPAAGTRAARPHRHQRAGRGPRPQDRRAGPVQARPPHRRRPRRLPPGAVPRRHRQDPLPAAAGVDDPGPGPPRDPAAPGTPPGLLRPADHHRPARRARQDRAESTTTRPRPGAAPTPAAPAPSAASPPPRTPPATTSAAAGAASWAWHP